MATYLQGQQDYVTQLQPTQPNLQFDAQMLGNLQNKYDAGHKKVSELYGSLLNAGMTRTDNIEARNEFFQMINQDIRRMGSLDFSLQQNVDAAANVFQSIYTNKGIVKDMVWTKNYKNQMSKRDGLKNCVDTEKCGGSVWDIGDRAMAYQREAFKNATADEALGMRDVEYVPQQNMMKDAIKLAKAADLNVTIDEISGKYKITTKNGELIKTPLTILFSETFAKDPKYKAMYDTKAYVGREDWTHNRVKKGEAADLDQAKIDYLEDFKTKQKNQLEKSASALKVDLDYLDKKVASEEKDLKDGKFKQNSDRAQRLINLRHLQGSAASAKAYTDQLIAASKATNPDAAYDVLAGNVDAQRSYDYMNKDITAAVRTLAFKDAEQTMTADEFAKLGVQHSNKLSEMAAKHKYDQRLQWQKDKAAKERTEITALGATVSAQNTLNTKNANIAKIKNEVAKGKYTKDGVMSLARADTDWGNADVKYPVSTDQVEAWKDSKHKNYDLYLKILRKYMDIRDGKKITANNDFIYTNKAGNVSEDYSSIPFPDVLTKSALGAGFDYKMQDGKTVNDKFLDYAVTKLGYDSDDEAGKKKVFGWTEDFMNDTSINGDANIIEHLLKKQKQERNNG